MKTKEYSSYILWRPEFESELCNLAGEAEWHLVIPVVDWLAQVNTDIEGLVPRHDEGNGVQDLLVGDFVVIHLQDTGPALAEARSVVGEVKDDGMFARREPLLPFSAEALHIQGVVEEHWLALQQVQAIAAEPAPIGEQHALRAASQNGNQR